MGLPLSSPPEIAGHGGQGFVLPAIPVCGDRESSAAFEQGFRRNFDLDHGFRSSFSRSFQRSGGKSDTEKKAKSGNLTSRALASIESGFRGDGLDGFEQGKALIRVRRGGNLSVRLTPKDRAGFCMRQGRAGRSDGPGVAGREGEQEDEADKIRRRDARHADRFLKV